MREAHSKAEAEAKWLIEVAEEQAERLLVEAKAEAARVSREAEEAKARMGREAEEADGQRVGRAVVRLGLAAAVGRVVVLLLDVLKHRGDGRRREGLWHRREVVLEDALVRLVVLVVLVASSLSVFAGSSLLSLFAGVLLRTTLLLWRGSCISTFQRLVLVSRTCNFLIVVRIPRFCVFQ